MALNDPTPQSYNNNNEESESESDEQDLEILESQVKQMAMKILEYRDTLPNQLKNTFTSLLSAQRPIFPGSDPGPFSHQDSGGPAETSQVVAIIDKEQKTTEKICLLKEKISSNVSALPVVLKRMKECISKIDKLDSYNGIIHPAFKKKRTS